ncbi:MAG: hypothetical protein M3O09_18180 [Acidobacteriota bacterium]|nr:hypothetical protein [Acidobacteriota bacterium]
MRTTDLTDSPESALDVAAPARLTVDEMAKALEKPKVFTERDHHAALRRELEHTVEILETTELPKLKQAIKDLDSLIWNADHDPNLQYHQQKAAQFYPRPQLDKAEPTSGQ